MGEEETVKEVPEVVANGTTDPGKSGNKGLEMEEDKKDNEKAKTEKMNEDIEVNEKKVSKEENEEEEEVEEGKLSKEGKEEEEEDTKEGKEEAKVSKEEKEMEDEEEGGRGGKKVSKDEEEEEVEAQEEEGNEEAKTEAMEEEAESKGDEIEEKGETKKVEEKIDDGHKEEEKKEETNEEERKSKKRGKGRGGAEKKSAEGIAGKKKRVAEVRKKKRVAEVKKKPETRTPATDRPQRERKTVERLVESIARDAAKEFQIEKGQGTPLKDIPNVAFKLSRKKSDDNFKLLHSILFGRRGKAIQIKTNISRFSGFVWHENEEKQKIKVKEKFEKINKETLLEFCDVLDIPIARATTRKEDIVIKLIDFLVSPHATTTVLLAEKEKGSKSVKRKRGAKSSNRPAKDIVQSRRKDGDALKTDHKSFPGSEDESDEEKEEDEEEQEEKVEEENENVITERFNSKTPEHSSSEEKHESEEESEEGTRKRKRSSKMSSRKKESSGKSKPKKVPVTDKSGPRPKRTPKTSSSKRVLADDDKDTRPKISSRKKKDEQVKDKSSTAKKSASKETSGKVTARQEEKAIEEKVNASDDELRVAVCEILKQVDFNTATLTDILKLLAKRFRMDFTPRKASIKLMVQQELTKLVDLAEDEAA